MFKNILLAVDGSEHALRAARVAGDLARRMNATVRVVVAFDPVPSYLGEPNLERAVSARVEAADKILSSATEVLGELPDLHSEVIEAPAAEAILKVAEVRQNDLIVMGSRGLGQLAGLLLGSQSQKVVSHAQCPVLIVR